jgi:two-component system, NarL family, sensor kinase
MRGEAMSVENRAAVAEPGQRTTATGGWVTLVDGAAAGQRTRPPSVGRVVGRFVVANLIAVALLMAGSVWASGMAAKDEAISEARTATDLLAMLLVEPALDERLPAGDPAAVAALDAVLRDRMQAADVIRVKIWNPDGEIVYSDRSELIGRTYPLSEDDQEALEDKVTRAELSDLSRPENEFEQQAGRLLEVYRQIETPGGQPMLLETYSSYADAAQRQVDIWLEFAPISVAVLLVLLAMQLPLAHRMVSQLRAAERERELLVARALDASTEERRRIAGSLHDGIVQDVSASSLLVANAAETVRAGVPAGAAEDVADDLSEASRALRHSAGSLRSLLVEIYPPNLERAGLYSALADLGARLKPRGIDVRVRVPERLGAPLETATLLFRTAQEALLNVAKHARAQHVEVTVRKTPGQLVLEVADDGRGFDLPATLTGPRTGHLGLSVLADLASAGGGTLDVQTAPGAGTRLRLSVPRR